VSAEQLRNAMHWMREANFESVNVDLICGLPLQTPERFETTLKLVRELLPERISLFSFAYLPEILPMQRKICPDDLPSQRERISMLDNANRLLTSHGYEAIGMDHYALSEDTLAIAAREGQLHRNFQGYTTGGELDLLGIGPTAISQFTHLFSQNKRELKDWRAAIEAGQLPVERGLEVNDPDVLERRALIKEVMCNFYVEVSLARFASEWVDFQELAKDGLLELQRNGDLGEVTVTTEGRWLIRTIAAVFDPQQRSQASGSRLV
ncbi:MAG TPA: oxygen-independent coproporphyrinogen III oxidase, partial [Prochlorococcaceae cyanobacterium Gl_MAG_24]|nr:oxygen-independent coproporphyrinogen III oxidase [Prochlorococcaceae cyanobacterium Gl_MAG_24]